MLSKPIGCVFPLATKPWQKFACGAIGIGCVGGGVLASFYFMEKGLTAVDRRIRQAKTPTHLDTLFTVMKQREIAVTVALGVVVPTITGVGMIHALIRDPWGAYNAFLEEWRLFRSSIAGTKCCHIVRSTARFATIGTIVSVCAFVIVPVLPFIAFGSLALAAYTTTKLYHTVTKKKNGTDHGSTDRGTTKD